MVIEHSRNEYVCFLKAENTDSSSCPVGLKDQMFVHLKRKHIQHGSQVISRKGLAISRLQHSETNKQTNKQQD
jgi:hypothetical protein